MGSEDIEYPGTLVASRETVQRKRNLIRYQVRAADVSHTACIRSGALQAKLGMCMYTCSLHAPAGRRIGGDEAG